MFCTRLCYICSPELARHFHAFEYHNQCNLHIIQFRPSQSHFITATYSTFAYRSLAISETELITDRDRIGVKVAQTFAVLTIASPSKADSYHSFSTVQIRFLIQ